MKFAIVVVVLSLALSIESYALPYEVPVVPVEGSYVAKTQGVVHVAPLSGHANSAAAINVESAPGTVPANGPQAEYVAKTQGAVHVAPLSGHAKSVVADNNVPAPGTTHDSVISAAVPAYISAAPHVPIAAPIIAPVAQVEGEYVARTQGAVHVAPLAGHAKSVASINDAAAPGTSYGWAAPPFAPIHTPAVGYSVIAAHPPFAAPAPARVPTVEGSYVAKTRGAVHVAPLAGHALSAASINLQPAPGTVH